MEVIALGPPKAEADEAATPTTTMDVVVAVGDAAGSEGALRRRAARRARSAAAVATMRLTGAAVLARLQASFKVGGWVPSLVSMGVCPRSMAYNVEGLSLPLSLFK